MVLRCSCVSLPSSSYPLHRHFVRPCCAVLACGCRVHLCCVAVEMTPSVHRWLLPLSVLLCSLLLTHFTYVHADDDATGSSTPTGGRVRWFVLIDGGSTGSRAHVHRYTMDAGKPLPVVEESINKKIKPGQTHCRETARWRGGVASLGAACSELLIPRDQSIVHDARSQQLCFESTRCECIDQGPPRLHQGDRTQTGVEPDAHSFACQSG